MKKVAIIGAGTAGCAAAYQFEKLGGWQIDLYEGGKYLGAGVRTHFKGGHPYTFGPRHFLTKNQTVFEYLNNVVPMRQLKHKFLTYLEEEADFFSYPISALDIPKMTQSSKIESELKNIASEIVSEPNNLEEYWISKVGVTLYNKFINQYSKKMWQINDNKEIDTFNWSPKGTPIKKDNSHAWSEAISAYPIALNGYNDFFDKIKRFTNVYLNTKVEEFFPEDNSITVGGNKLQYDIVVNTIALDDIMKRNYGALPFIGRNLTTIILPIENAFPENVFFLYYANSEPYTRIVEYKKLSGYQSNTTLIGIEYPSMNGKHYPLPISKYIEIHKKYKSELGSRTYSIGRAGSYNYQVDIDDCIEQALNIYEELK